MLLERIKERAKQFGLSLSDVAEKTGISPNTVYSWRVKTPRSDKLKQVAELLHTTTDYLNGLTDDPNPISSNRPSAIDLKEPHIFSYGGKPISDDDMEIIRSILERHRNENGN